jgi:peptidyl-dipeptidase Dcp
LKELQNRSLRERIQKASLTRNSRGGEYDNRENVAKAAKLRAERARLLGYPHHAAYQLEEQTARDVERVNALLARLAPAAVAYAKTEAADLQGMIDAEKGGFQLAPWDWSYYAEKVRKDRFDFDESQLRPYLEMNRVLKDGVFFAASRLYGIRFQERTDLPKYHPDTSIHEVFNEDGSSLALLIIDWYARPSKRGRSAWATTSTSGTATACARPCSGAGAGTAAFPPPTRNGCTSPSSPTPSTATRP